MLDLSVCIVAFRNPPSQLLAAVQSVLGSRLDLHLVIMDHSPERGLEAAMPRDPRLSYLHNPANPGFGAGHNAVARMYAGTSRFHLILNPDVIFDPAILAEMVTFLDHHPEVGLIAPKVVFPSGELQPLCKLLPSPINMILRMLLPNSRLVRRRDQHFHLEWTGYQQIMNVPFLSGCFMLVPMAVFCEVGLFDESYFVYYEDLDLCRRIHARYQTLFYPWTTITHEFGRASFKNRKMLKIHIASALYYFNKWGWILDPERKRINTAFMKRYACLRSR